MIGQKLGSFLIESELGSGAMGVVYRALNEKTGKPAAVKVVTAEMGAKAGASKRFEREAAILQQFRHPNIVRFLAVGRYQGTSYFAMEYIQGKTLDQILELGGPMEWPRVVELGAQLCEALQYAHERGVVHRDLKPSNLMLTDQGQLKLTDFGIAKDLDATALTATGRTLGTAAYMAPEQITGAPAVSHKTDLYAFGCLLYQMLTGLPPFRGKQVAVLMNQHINEPPPRPSEKSGDIPLALENLISGPETDSAGAPSRKARQDKIGLIVNDRGRPHYLLEKDPNFRPRDAQAVAEILRKLVAGAERHQTLPMVFGGDGQPTRLGMVTPAMAAGPTLSTGVPGGETKGATKATKVGRKKGKASAEFTPPAWLSTAGWVGALVALIGLGIYLAWPKSAKTMMAEASTRMASKDTGMWLLAQQEYFDAIEGKIADPDHPYRAQVRAWRDKIGLEKARRRADILDRPNLPTAVSQPNPEIRGEGLYVSHSTAATAALRAGRDGAAAREWDALARLMKSDDPSERPWFLLAQERAATVRKEMENRQAMVAQLLDKADDVARQGHGDEADAIRRDVFERYGEKKDLLPLLQARGALPRGGESDETKSPSTKPKP